MERERFKAKKIRTEMPLMIKPCFIVKGCPWSYTIKMSSQQSFIRKDWVPMWWCKISGRDDRKTNKLSNEVMESEDKAIHYRTKDSE